MIPAVLKKAIGIKNQIVVAGVLNKIEIWPKEQYDSHLNAMLSGKDKDMNLSKMTEEAFALLGDNDAGLDNDTE